MGCSYVSSQVLHDQVLTKSLQFASFSRLWAANTPSLSGSSSLSASLCPTSSAVSRPSGWVHGPRRMIALNTMRMSTSSSKCQICSMNPLIAHGARSYLGVFVIFVALSCLTYTTGISVYVFGIIRAARKIHKQLVNSILGTTLLRPALVSAPGIRPSISK